jgi:hypothetical protein
MHVTAHTNNMSHTPSSLGPPYGPYLGLILFFKREKERNIDFDNCTQLSNLLYSACYEFCLPLGLARKYTIPINRVNVLR